MTFDFALLSGTLVTKKRNLILIENVEFLNALSGSRKDNFSTTHNAKGSSYSSLNIGDVKDR